MATILFVCTGNVCRSPYLEFAVRDALWSGGVFDITVGSAGTRAMVGHPVARPLLERLAGMGIDASTHSAKPLTDGLLADAGLILTATRDHRREVAQRSPAAAGRTFTVLQFARLLADSPTGAGDLDAAIAAALAGRGRSGRGSGDDDIEDPWGRSPRIYRRIAAHMDEGLRPLIRFLTRPVSPRGAASSDHSPRTA